MKVMALNDLEVEAVACSGKVRWRRRRALNGAHRAWWRLMRPPTNQNNVGSIEA